MSERQRELYQEIERRVSNALQASQISSSVNVQANSDNQVNYSNNLTENEAYDHAVNLVLKDKLYEQAIPAFKQFNQKFPQSTYAANAHYWLGQLLFNKAEYSLAASEFMIVVNQFNDSSKRADALLKLAMVNQKQDKNTAAITLYRQLIKEYPNSTAAQLAQPRLNNLTE
jgi:tol-pal system protein YbgF